MKPTESLVGLIFFFVKFFVPYLTTAYGQPEKSLISCGFARLDLFTSTCFCLSWCVTASVFSGVNGFWLRSISIENIEVVSNEMDWKSRHLEAEKRKAEIRDRIHKQTEQGQKSAKDYFRPAKPTPSIYDSDLKRVAVYARVSTSSEEQISSIENQTLYYTKKIAETENWNLQDIYSDEGKSGTSLRKRDAFKRMMRDAKDQKMDLIQALLEANELAVGKDHQFKGRYEAEKNAVIISLEKDEREW